jgi:hypothetical protein
LNDWYAMTAPAPVLRGPHHCIANANAVAEMIFRYLQSRCTATGSLSAADLDAARAHLAQSFPNAFSFFETVNQRCMEASAATAPAFFAKENILGSLLFTCAHKAARSAFPNQIGRFGAPWLNQFFGGFAEYIRQHTCPTADDRLMKVYAIAAGKIGARLTVTDLLNEDGARKVLHECLAPFMLPDAPAAFAAKLSDVVSFHIAAARGIPKPDISKVIEQEARSFLTWLPPQVNVALSGADASAARGNSTSAAAATR